MGNSVNAGIGVLNKSEFSTINVGLSQGFTHYYENDINNGEIFYRWPGAVWYTVYVTNGDNRLSHGQVKVSYNGVAYGKMSGVYAGGSGTWLVVEKDNCTNSPLAIRKATKAEIFRDGKFTDYSHDRYHTAPSLKCTANCEVCCHSH